MKWKMAVLAITGWTILQIARAIDLITGRMNTVNGPRKNINQINS